MSTTTITLTYNDDKKGTLAVRRDNLSVMLPIDLATDDEKLSAAIDEAISEGFAALADLESNPPDTTTVAAKAAAVAAKAAAAPARKAPGKAAPPAQIGTGQDLFDF